MKYYIFFFPNQLQKNVVLLEQININHLHSFTQLNPIYTYIHSYKVEVVSVVEEYDVIYAYLIFNNHFHNNIASLTQTTCHYRENYHGVGCLVTVVYVYFEDLLTCLSMRIFP